MTRAEKIAKRKARAKRRADKYNDKYRALSRKASEAQVSIQLVKRGFWGDPSSPTGRSQNCTMGGTCQFPCNGDC